MTVEEKKKYLMQYRHIDEEIDRLLEERCRLAAQATKITATISSVPYGTGCGDRVGEWAVKLAALDELMDERISRLMDLRREIQGQVDAIEDPVLRRIVVLRYIDAMTWEEIAEKMHYTFRWVMKLHGRALNQLRIGKT